jgi:hypothetical protein
MPAILFRLGIFPYGPNDPQGSPRKPSYILVHSIHIPVMTRRDRRV